MFCSFSSCAEEAAAADMHRSMPPALLALFTEQYSGGLVALPDTKGIRTPSAAEVSLNYVFLLPLVRAYPSKVWLMGKSDGKQFKGKS